MGSSLLFVYVLSFVLLSLDSRSAYLSLGKALPYLCTLYVRARKMCGVYLWCVGKATWSVGDAFLWVGTLWCYGLSLRGWR